MRAIIMHTQSFHRLLHAHLRNGHIHCYLLLINVQTVHSPLFSPKMVEIERFAVRAAIMDERLPPPK